MTTFLLDVNVVLAAHRVDHAHYGLARPWVDDLLGGSHRFSLPSAVCGSFVRIATSRRVFVNPTPLGVAFRFMMALRAHPSHVLAEPGRRHLELLEQVCLGADATGDLVPDAVLAALALEHACTVASLDRDFARFAAVPWVRPGALG